MSFLNAGNRFTTNPINLDISRSRFKIPFTHKTSFNSGDIVPLYWTEVLPGDTIDMNLSFVTRMITPVVPVMDNCFIDIYFFFVPNRLTSEVTIDQSSATNDWETFMGANKSGFWANKEETTLLKVPVYDVKPGSVANYLGLPIFYFTDEGSQTIEPYINIIAFAAYNLIYNEWFRDENLIAPIPLNYGLLGTNEEYAINILGPNSQPGYGATGSCLKASKFHDYFTSALPSPQKGDSVTLPLGQQAIVKTSDEPLFEFSSSNDVPIKFYGSDGPVSQPYSTKVIPGGDSRSGSLTIDAPITSGTGTDGSQLTPNNLYADLANATATTVNQLRQAFAVQRLLEKDARGGTRYIEMLKAHFGTAPKDQTLQRPEYLGGKRIPINIDQVLQSSGTTDVSPLGTTGAWSNTGNRDHYFTKSFTEHGVVMCLGIVRTTQTYCQGIGREWTRFNRFDYYFPVFANLGEQAIYNKEIYLQGSSEDDEVFGYQEAWAEYRYKPSLVTGFMAPNSGDNILGTWTYCNLFSTLPTLSQSFLEQSSSNIGRTLVDIESNTQFIGDFAFDATFTRPMPVRSIPGLIDHH